MPLPRGRSGNAGSGKANKTGRHRPVQPANDPQAPDHELESYLAAISPDGDPESTGAGRRFNNAQVYQLRLSPIHNEHLKALAGRANTSPQALAQEWLEQRLNWEAAQQPGQHG